MGNTMTLLDPIERRKVVLADLPQELRAGDVERKLDALAEEIERREAESHARAQARILFDLD